MQWLSVLALGSSSKKVASLLAVILVQIAVIFNVEVIHGLCFSAAALLNALGFYDIIGY